MKSANNKSYTLLLAGIVLIAFILRFTSLFSFSLMNDELSMLYRLNFDSFNELIEKGVMIEGHPAFVQVLMYYWVDLFGTTELNLRILPVLCGTLAVYYSYKFTALIINKNAGIIAAVAFSFLQYHILYTIIDRPYAYGTFFSIWFAYYWAKVLYKPFETSILTILAFSISGALAMYTHYFSGLQVILIALTGLLFLNKQNRKNYWIGFFLAIILYLPHLKISLHQISMGGLGGEGGWLGAPTPAFIKEHFWMLINGSGIVLTALLLAIISTFMLGERTKKVKLRTTLLFWFALPFAIGYTYSVYKNPVLQHNVLIFSFPYLIIWWCSFVPNQLPKKVLTIVAISLLSIGLIDTVLIQKFYTTDHFVPFGKYAKRTIELDKKYAGNIRSAIDVNNPDYIGYYFEKFEAKQPYKTHLVVEENLHELNSIVHQGQDDYFLWVEAKGSPNSAQEIVFKRYPNIVESSIRANSTFKLLSKTEGKMRKAFFEDKIELNDTIQLDSNTNILGLNMIDKDFSPTFEFKGSELTSTKRGDKRIVASAKVWLPQQVNAELVLSVDRDGETVYWVSSRFKNQTDRYNQWETVILGRYLEDIILPDDIIKVHVWNVEKQPFYIQNLEFKILEDL